MPGACLLFEHDDSQSTGLFQLVEVESTVACNTPFWAVCLCPCLVAMPGSVRSQDTLSILGMPEQLFLQCTTFDGHGFELHPGCFNSPHLHLLHTHLCLSSGIFPRSWVITCLGRQARYICIRCSWIIEKDVEGEPRIIGNDHEYTSILVFYWTIVENSML